MSDSLSIADQSEIHDRNHSGQQYAVAVEAMVDRLVHHSHIFTLKGDSYRLKDKQDELATTNDNR